MKKVALGFLIGVIATLLAFGAFRYLRFRPYKEMDDVMRWAYKHVPSALGPPLTARVLEPEIETVAATPSEESRGERMFRVRLVYQIADKIKVIRFTCHTVKGDIVSPTDDELRALDAKTEGVPVPN
jgi:hypothetical protein